MAQSRKETTVSISRVFGNVCALLLMTLVLRPPPALADPAVLILDNPQRQGFTGFSSSLAVVGDTNGDGVTDYLIGARVSRHAQYKTGASLCVEWAERSALTHD